MPAEGPVDTGGVSAPPGFTILAYGPVESTQEEAKRLAADGAADGTVVWAESQSAGRGRRDRQWNSPPGNLYASLILRPRETAATAAQLSFVTALALADAIVLNGPPDLPLTLKWPNDILVADRKVAGILLESSARPDAGLDWLIVGTGVNITTAPTGTKMPAGALVEAGISRLTPDRLLGDYLAAFSGWRSRWMASGFEPVRTAWLARAKGVGGAISVRLSDGSAYGRFETLDENGALVLRHDDGSRRRIAAGDVYFGN